MTSRGVAHWEVATRAALHLGAVAAARFRARKSDFGRSKTQLSSTQRPGRPPSQPCNLVASGGPRPGHLLAMSLDRCAAGRWMTSGPDPWLLSGRPEGKAAPLANAPAAAEALPAAAAKVAAKAKASKEPKAPAAVAVPKAKAPQAAAVPKAKAPKAAAAAKAKAPKAAKAPAAAAAKAEAPKAPKATAAVAAPKAKAPKARTKAGKDTQRRGAPKGSRAAAAYAAGRAAAREQAPEVLAVARGALMLACGAEAAAAAKAKATKAPKRKQAGHKSPGVLAGRARPGEAGGCCSAA